MLTYGKLRICKPHELSPTSDIKSRTSATKIFGYELVQPVNSELVQKVCGFFCCGIARGVNFKRRRTASEHRENVGLLYRLSKSSRRRFRMGKDIVRAFYFIIRPLCGYVVGGWCASENDLDSAEAMPAVFRHNLLEKSTANVFGISMARCPTMDVSTVDWTRLFAHAKVHNTRGHYTKQFAVFWGRLDPAQVLRFRFVSQIRVFHKQTRKHNITQNYTLSALT